MNDPEYILSDVIREVVASTSAALTANDSTTFPNPIHYEHGYIHELNETLQQWNKNPAKYKLIFPLVWFIETGKEKRGMLDYYSELNGQQMFIINRTNKTWKGDERDSNNYIPIIYPIYREVMAQLFLHPALSFDGSVANPQGIKHNKIKAPYWGEDQKSVLIDTVDCLKIEDLNFKIKNNPNCS